MVIHVDTAKMDSLWKRCRNAVVYIQGHCVALVKALNLHVVWIHVFVLCSHLSCLCNWRDPREEMNSSLLWTDWGDGLLWYRGRCSFCLRWKKSNSMVHFMNTFCITRLCSFNIYHFSSEPGTTYLLLLWEVAGRREGASLFFMKEGLKDIRYSIYTMQFGGSSRTWSDLQSIIQCANETHGNKRHCNQFL